MLEEKPLSKKMKSSFSENVLHEVLMDFNDAITGTLQSISEKLDILSNTWNTLETKIDDLTGEVCKKNHFMDSSVLHSRQLKQSLHMLPTKITYLTLNQEEDYPDGSWLGDERNPEYRVRCHLLPTEMFFIHSTCTTAEKMALTLLDYLFDGETLAASNISGAGKHKKKQLNPLYIYGIKCHLMFHYGITESDWNKIKQNLDSKCRTAFRRKMKGLSFTSKGKSFYHKKFYKTKKEKNANSLGSIFTEVSNDNNRTLQKICSIPEAHILSNVIKETQMLRVGPKNFSNVPKETKSATVSLQNRDSDCEEDPSVPEFRQSFSDAIEMALNSVSLQDPISNQNTSKRKKKGKKQQLLFTTSMCRNK